MVSIEELRDRCSKKMNENEDGKYELISKILSFDDCFFRMDMNVALDILSSLDVLNPLENYKQLISYEEMEKNKISIID